MFLCLLHLTGPGGLGLLALGAGMIAVGVFWPRQSARKK